MAEDINALSGFNLFNLNRNVLFGFAGTIFTYELVMIQFQGENNEIDNNITCY